MNILWVNPETPKDTYWSFTYALSLKGKRAAFPPLGILTAAAMLPAGWDQRLVDLNVRNLKDKDLRWADAVFISGMTIQRASFDEALDRAKVYGLPVVAGGPMVTADYAESGCVDDRIDHLIIGEPEEIMSGFAADFERGEAKRVYAPQGRPPLSSAPIPAYKAISLRPYNSMSVQYSRGCPNNCDFCDIIELYGRKVRTKSNDQMVAELQALYDQGWRGSVFFGDDNFIGNKAKVKQLLPGITGWQHDHKYPFAFFTQASVNLAEDDDLLDMMTDAGFRKVFLGIETPEEECLLQAGKRVNLHGMPLEDKVRKIQESGMEVMAGFILGFDADKESTFDRMKSFIQESGIPLSMVGLLTAMKGTQLYRRLKEEKRLLGESDGNNTHNSVNFIPKMQLDKLMEKYRDVLGSIYSPKEYYSRCLRFLERYNPKRIHVNPNFADVRAFVTSMIKQGIFEKGRLEYWDFLGRAFATNPKAFSTAVTLAIMGRHFTHITEQYISSR
ncbi:DUF4070 domain-containing protein [Candidatus Woesearchaeota archaeon]|nr:DUF4070 domain-containing protein [Candidatus Woesearchaeota archaeon]